MFKILKSNRGFSYLEVMLSLVLFSFILSMGFQFYSNNQKLMEREIHNEEIQTHVRTLLNRTALELSYGENLTKVDDLIVSVNQEGSFTPIVDLSGFTQRGRINLVTDIDEIKVVNQKGETISDQIIEFSIEEENDLFIIKVIAELNGKEFISLKKIYKHKL